jgi:hypothetical protein
VSPKGAKATKPKAKKSSPKLPKQPKAKQPKAKQPKAKQPKAKQPKAKQPKAKQPKAKGNPASRPGAVRECLNRTGSALTQCVRRLSCPTGARRRALNTCTRQRRMVACVNRQWSCV